MCTFGTRGLATGGGEKRETAKSNPKWRILSASRNIYRSAGVRNPRASRGVLVEGAGKGAGGKEGRLPIIAQKWRDLAVNIDIY